MKLTAQQQSQRTARGPLVEALAEADCQVTNDRRVYCPFHDDEHPSAQVKPGKDDVHRLHCYAGSCGFYGDVYDVRAKISGRSLANVLAEARGHTGRQAAPRARGNCTPQPATDQGSKKAPKRYPNIEAVTKRLPGFEHVWAWIEDNGELRGWSVRYRPPGEHKKMLQATPCEGGVILKGPKPPYPLLYSAKVKAAPRVIVSEGEPKADIIERIGLEGLAATSTLGGAGPKKELLTDWRPLRSKIVYLWPDADEGGIAFMQAIAERLWSLYPRPTIFWIEPAALGLSQKGDVVDYLRDVPEGQRRRKLLDVLDAAEPWKSTRPTLAAGVRQNSWEGRALILPRGPLF